MFSRFKSAARLLLVAALIVGTPSAAVGVVYAVAKRAPNQPYAALIVPIGDSITYGVNADTLAGWREYVYNASRVGGSTQIVYFTGTQSFSGNATGLAADPYNEGRPGWVVKAAAAQSPPSSFGSLNDISNQAGNRGAVITILAGGTNDLASNVMNDSTSNVIASISTWLDNVWAFRTTPRHQIVLCEILKRLDADDAKVVIVNAALPALIAGKSYAANITLIHMYDAIVDPTITTGGYHDAVHPNDVGYNDMGARMWTGGLQAAIAHSKG